MTILHKTAGTMAAVLMAGGAGLAVPAAAQAGVAPGARVAAAHAVPASACSNYKELADHYYSLAAQARADGRDSAAASYEAKANYYETKYQECSH